MSEVDAWASFVDEITPHVSPEWLRQARDHGEQGWIRLIALVDVQNTLCSPQIVEKVAVTMADLADGRSGDADGWTAIQRGALDKRIELLHRIDELSSELLSPELHQLYLRSAQPIPQPM